MFVTSASRIGLAASRRELRSACVRNITVGTDMLSSIISLQTARPWYMTDEQSNLAADNAVPLTDLFAKKRVVVFGVPAPYTGVCTNEHYPGYKSMADEIFNAGVDEIVCYSVADPYSHYHWSKLLHNEETKIKFLADADGTFAKAYGVDADYSAVSLGVRSKRFSMVVEDGQVQIFNIVDDAKTDAETILNGLKEMNENSTTA